MESVDIDQFLRYMSSPPSPIYIESCSLQSEEDKGDFVCQFQEMIKPITSKEIYSAMNYMKTSILFDQP
jgi:hypothetical protein